jgi:hypothetical protein
MGLEVVAYVIAGLLAVGVPGFLFSLVLYPKLGDMDFWMRAGSSLGLGAILILLEGYSLARVHSLTLGGFVMSTAVTSGILLAGVYIRGGAGVVSAYWNGFIRGLRGLYQTKLKLVAGKIRPKAKPSSEKPQAEAAPHHTPATEHPHEPAHHPPAAEHSPAHKEKT